MQQQFRNTSRDAVIFVLGAIAALSLAILSNTATGQAAPSTQNSSGDWKQVEDAMGRPAATSPEALGIDQKKIEDLLGHPGKVNGGVLQITVPRAETITDNGMAVPPSMGVGSALNFQPTGNGKAAITGDFVLAGKEVNPVMKALRENGIEITALHSHMLTEEPRLFFMHFWANDDAMKLANGLRAAVDITNSKK